MTNIDNIKITLNEFYNIINNYDIEGYQVLCNKCGHIEDNISNHNKNYLTIVIKNAKSKEISCFKCGSNLYTINAYINE